MYIELLHKTENIGLSKKCYFKEAVKYVSEDSKIDRDNKSDTWKICLKWTVNNETSSTESHSIISWKVGFHFVLKGLPIDQ